LRDLWAQVEANKLSASAAMEKQDRLMDEYRKVWFDALLIPGEDNLTHSAIVEIARYRGLDDLEIVRRRCEDAVGRLKHEWQHIVQAIEAHQVERFYDLSETYIDELMWWHTLNEDDTPLAYVVAVKFAEAKSCKHVLDFGAGVGSGALLFNRQGFEVALADVSSTLLGFSGWRFNQRGHSARFIDLKTENLPCEAFDFITAMDVFEHLIDPVSAVDALAASLKPGGFVYGRFAAEVDSERPQHIVHDFRPVFERFDTLGFHEIWRDDWIWGHQVFQKSL
jgi:SAM-dependent methyltransferase